MSNLKRQKISSLFAKGAVKPPKPDERWALPSCYIGIEIEVENCAPSDDQTNDLAEVGWLTKTDQSLMSGREFVFHQPMLGEDISTAVDYFFNHEERGFSYDVNGRTGTHIHVNWLDGSTLDSIYRLIAVMYCIEPAVFELSDPGRKWCGFCLQITDINASTIRTILTTESVTSLVQQFKGTNTRSRYFGTNLHALSKFGTVEFRHFPGVTTKQDMEDWINLCMMIKKACCESDDDVVDIISQLSSAEGIISYIQQHFRVGNSNLADRMIAGLDIDRAVSRMEALSNILNVTPTKARPSNHTQTSPTGSKVAAALFPQIAETVERRKVIFDKTQMLYSNTITEEQRSALYRELIEMGAL